MFNTPLLMHEIKLYTIAKFVGPEVLGCNIILDDDGKVEIEAQYIKPSAGILGQKIKAALDEQGLSSLRVLKGGVGYIPIEGSLVHKGGWLGSYSGMTSYEGIQAQVNEAAARDDVKGVVFELDSFGGEVSGAFDTAGLIHDLSRSKPTIAIGTDNACSAGYLMASAARQFVLPSTGNTGSIGVVALHVDKSQYIEKMGVKVTVLRAGNSKAEGSPYEPLADGTLKRWTSQLEETRKEFAKAVALHRGNRISYDAIMDTEGASMTGTDAVASGLADAIMRPTEAFKLFSDGIAGNGSF
jgi:ClpP class serine protease